MAVVEVRIPMTPVITMHVYGNARWSFGRMENTALSFPVQTLQEIREAMEGTNS